MKIEFELSPYWIEFACHFFAIILTLNSGVIIGEWDRRSNVEFKTWLRTYVSILIAIALTIYGAHL